jgi:hypothetical protein
MKTTKQLLTLAMLALLSLVSYVAPARAQHYHNHLGQVFEAAADIASHARHVQLGVRTSGLPYSEIRDLSVDAAQLEVSARRLQVYVRGHNLGMAQQELNTARDLARHLSSHARMDGLGYSLEFRGELSNIFQDLNLIAEELNAQQSHYRPQPTRSFGQPLRPRVVFSFSP